LPEKDNISGTIGATAALNNNNNPKVVRPVKPTLPDLYQVNFL